MSQQKKSRALVVVVQSLSPIWPFVTPWTAACQASLSFTISCSLLKLFPLSWWWYPTSSSSVVPFSSCLQYFQASGSFQMSLLFSSDNQRFSASASASVLPRNIQGLISFRTDWFDLLAFQGTHKSLLQHHSSKASVFWHSTFFKVQLSHPYDYWKKYSFVLIIICFYVIYSSVTQSCPTLCDPMNCNTPGFPVNHQFLEFTQTHVHRVSDAI